MKSAIGEGMTRKDHSDVSNQLVSQILKLFNLQLQLTQDLIYVFFS